MILPSLTDRGPCPASRQDLSTNHGGVALSIKFEPVAINCPTTTSGVTAARVDFDRRRCIGALNQKSFYDELATVFETVAI